MDHLSTGYLGGSNRNEGESCSKGRSSFTAELMARLYKHPLVEDDLAEIYAYIVRKSGHRKIALEVYDTIEQAFFQILENPLLGNPFPCDIPSLQGLQRYFVQSYKLRYHISPILSEF